MEVYHSVVNTKNAGIFNFSTTYKDGEKFAHSAGIDLSVASVSLGMDGDANLNAQAGIFGVSLQVGVSLKTGVTFDGSYTNSTGINGFKINFDLPASPLLVPIERGVQSSFAY